MVETRTEEQLYEPVKNYLQNLFAQYGECELEITKAKITEKAKRWLDDSALFFIRVEKKFPDIMGYFKPDPSKKSPYGFYEGLIITEVKNKEPLIKDIFQTKLYAEVFNAPYAYLISSKPMLEEMCRFLSKRYSLLYYGGNRKVYIGKYVRGASGAEIILELTLGEKEKRKPMINEHIDWYPENPFKSSQECV